MRYQQNGRSQHNNNRSRYSKNNRHKRYEKKNNPRINPLRHTFDSSGPNGRLRGNATQLAEKYKSLAHEARGADDLIIMERCLQYADHYQRLLLDYQDEEQQRKNASEERRMAEQDNDDDSSTAKDSDDAEQYNAVDINDDDNATIIQDDGVMPSFLAQPLSTVDDD